MNRLSGALVTVALCAAVIGSVGAPLITAVARSEHVTLGAAQWTLTITLFTGAIAGPVLGRLGAGPLRRRTILGTLGAVAVGGPVFAAAATGFAVAASLLCLASVRLGAAPSRAQRTRDAAVTASTATTRGRRAR